MQHCHEIANRPNHGCRCDYRVRSRRGIRTSTCPVHSRPNRIVRLLRRRHRREGSGLRGAELQVLRQWLDRNALCPPAISAPRNRFCVNPLFDRRMPHNQTVHIDESIQLPDAAATGNARIRSKWLHRKP